VNEVLKVRIEKAESLLQQGRLPSALFALNKVLRKDPDNVHALVLSAEHRFRDRKKTESVDLINKLFDMEPEHFGGELQKRLGHVCFENDLHVKASQLLEWARLVGIQDDLSLFQLGILNFHLLNTQAAEQRLMECVKSSPEFAAAYLELGNVCKAMGNSKGAAENYKKYIELSPDEKGSGYWYLADLGSYTFDDDDIAEIRREIESRQEDLPQLSALQFALGRVAEKNKDYAEAMRYYDDGNAIQARLKPFDVERYRRVVSGIQTVYADEKPTRSDKRPVAIMLVGLPRSGSTLIEQILSSHSRVQATDELRLLDNIASRMNSNGDYLKRLSSLTEDEKKILRQEYVSGACAYLRQDSDFFIDKNPRNFLQVGLAKRIMPEAVVIDMRRDPRDVAVSAYRQLFNLTYEFSTSFDGIYEYYKGYLKLIDHWRSVYPNQIKTVNYEELVSSPAEQIEALLSFCGLESEPACFEFYKQKRAVMTPSVGQVSKPMYTSSIGQWRHYEEYARDGMSRLESLLVLDDKKNRR